jgi:nitrous oxide reductase accessory protein NosL
VTLVESDFRVNGEHIEMRRTLIAAAMCALVAGPAGAADRAGALTQPLLTRALSLLHSLYLEEYPMWRAQAILAACGDRRDPILTPEASAWVVRGAMRHARLSRPPANK